MREYEMSVIEREVEVGILNVGPKSKATSLAFFRTIQNMNMNDNKKAGEGKRPVHYVDMVGQKPDRHAAKLMSDLRSIKIPAVLDKANWRVNEVDWSAIIGHK